MAIYLKLGAIQGSAMTSEFENWIVLESFQWGFAAGYTAKQSNSEVSVREVVLTMRAEKASPLIVSAGVSRTVQPLAVFKFTTTSKDKVDTFMSYEFANCVITNYAISAPGEGPPTELFPSASPPSPRPSTRAIRSCSVPRRPSPTM